MKSVKVRKNFLFEKEVVETAQKLLYKRHKNLTQAITLYFKAIVKEPSLLDEIEKYAKKRTGSFVGMLDGKIGDESFKELKKEALKQSDL